MILLRVLPIKEGSGIGQTWLLGAASNGTHLTQWQGLRLGDPPVNIMEMVTKKCEEKKREMLVEVESIRDETRGEFEGAAIQM